MTWRMLFVVVVFCPLLSSQQQTHKPEYPSLLDNFMRPYPVVIRFDQEARASDVAGIHAYSDDLTWFLVRDRVDSDYRRRLTDRLAKAQEAAREGKGRLIPESDVVRVFNDMMHRIRAPRDIRADENAMRAFRQQSINVPSLPALFSASRNGTDCNPGEAVFLLYTLIVYNGVPPKDLFIQVKRLRDLYAGTPHPVLRLLPPVEGHLGDGGFGATLVETVGPPSPVEDAAGLLSSYAYKHNHQATSKLFDRVAQAFGF